MKISRQLTVFLHSIVGLSVGLIIVYFTLNFLRTKGPAIVKGPATALGMAISGQTWNF